MQFGQNSKIIPVYVTRVGQNGTRIWVSPWDSNAEFIATVLSPVPTDLLDGRRITGVPSARSEFRMGDIALAAVVDGKYYILGYFNLPHAATGETVSMVKNDEMLKPMEHGWIAKLSKLGSIVARKSNHVQIWLGTWANTEFKGAHLADPNREELLSTKVANWVVTLFGGMQRWKRKRDENTRMIDWETTYTASYHKSHEPAKISDIDLGTKEENQNIYDTASTTTPKNPGNLNYIDKAIIRAGRIPGEDNTHVYEIETRQSLDFDKTKTAFSKTRHGHRAGVLYEVTTENVKDESTTSLAFGQDTENGKLLSYVGARGSDKKVSFYQDDDGFTIVSTNNGDATSTVKINIDGTVSIDSSSDIAVTTGPGGFTVNGHHLATAEFVDFWNTWSTAMGMGNMGAPVPMFPGAKTAFTASYNVADTFKTDK